MNHREAIRLLPEHAAGELEARRSTAVEGHVADCESCRTWVEGYRFLEAALATPAAAVHPDSEILAQYAVEPGAVDPEDCASLERHLEGCVECDLLVRTAREAMQAAKQRPRRTQRPLAALHRGWWPALAATLLLVLAALLGLRWRSAGDGTEAEPARRAIRGTEVIEGDRQLLAADLEIGGGSDVTLRAAEVVALGNGFSVSADSRLAIQLDGTLTASADRRH